MAKANLPKVAILLAAYNGASWIEEQLATILNQSGVVVNVFISIDYSSDNTLEVLDEIRLNESRVSILKYGEKFGGAAKNFFRLIRDVDFLKYDYVAFADQDDVWLPNKISFAINQIEKKEVDAYSSDVLAFWQDGKKCLIKKSYPQKKFDFLYEAAGPGCTYVFKVPGLSCFKNFLLKNWGTVNEIALHDWLIYAYFRSNGFNWFIDYVPLIHYRQHEKNQVGVNSGMKAYGVRVSKVRNKWYRCQVEKIARLLGFDVPTRSFMLRNFLQLRRRSRDTFVLLIFVLFRLY